MLLLVDYCLALYSVHDEVWMLVALGTSRWWFGFMFRLQDS
jgi:hypothetical protein